MAKYTAIAKERVNGCGIKSLTYKVNRKIICEVVFPNEFADGFRMCGNGFCYDLHPTIETPKRSAESYLNRLYSPFGGIDIVYK